MRQPLTRDAIAIAARDILVTEGLHAVSLRRVASSLGVTAPALYAHVVDKRDLLQGIVEQEIEALIRRFEDVRADDPVDRLRGMAEAYVDWALQNPDLFRAMFLFRPELTAEPRGDDGALGAAIHEAFTRAVHAANERGALDHTEHDDLAALTLWSTVHGVVTVILSGPPLDLELKSRLTDAAIATALSGLKHGALANAA